MSKLELGTSLPPSPMDEAWQYDALKDLHSRGILDLRREPEAEHDEDDESYEADQPPEISQRPDPQFVVLLDQWLRHAATVERVLHGLDEELDIRGPFGMLVGELCQKAVGANPGSWPGWRLTHHNAEGLPSPAMYEILCFGQARLKAREAREGAGRGTGRHWRAKGLYAYPDEAKTRFEAVCSEGLDWGDVQRWTHRVYGADLADLFLHLGPSVRLGGWQGTALEVDVPE